MSSTGSRESRWRRAGRALPILGLSAVMMRAITMVEPIGPVLERVVERKYFDLGGVSAPILTEFYGVPLLDQVFTQITAAFAQLQFYSDPILYYQSFVFLTDYAGMYAILLLESTRGAPKLAVIQYPAVFTMFAQMIPIGLLSPVFFFLYYVFTPLDNFKEPAARSFDKAYAAAVLPTIALAYHLPHFLCYLHPLLEGRNWWNWIWQLYPVWGAVTLFLLSRLYNPQYERRILRSTAAVLGAISTAVYWYALSASEWPAKELFIPQYFLEKPGSAEMALRTVIQYDFICTFAAGYLWLVYGFWDLKASGVSVSWIRVSGAAAVIGTCFGPGAMLLAGWIKREELLTSKHRSRSNLGVKRRR